MLWAGAVSAGNPKIGTLEATVESARLALACSYSSSDEYEAALIQERRAAGAYESKARPMRLQSLLGAAVLLAFGALALAAI